MRDYSSFSASFWTGETGRKLHGDVDAQLLAAYLFTSRHGNLLGLYFLPLKYAEHETGLPMERLERALARLGEDDVRFAYYDRGTEHVWVVAMARRQISTSEKAIAGALRILRSSRRGPLFDRFVACYGANLEHLSAPPSVFSEKSSDTISSTSDTVSDVRLRQDKTRQDKTDPETPSAPVAIVEPKPPKADPVFAHWLAVMSKGAGTLLNAARKQKLKARRKEGYTDAQLCQAIDGCRRSEFHMGKNDRAEVFNDLATILRDGPTVEKHIERASGPVAPTPIQPNALEARIAALRTEKRRYCSGHDFSIPEQNRIDAEIQKLERQLPRQAGAR